MAKYIESLKLGVKYLEEVESLEDIKEKKDDITALLIDAVRQNIDNLKKLKSIPESEKEFFKAEQAKLKTEEKILREKAEKEKARIMKIEGAEELIRELQTEVMEKIAPYIQEMMMLSMQD